MKNRIYTMTIAALGLALVFSGCKSPEEKMIAHYEEMTEILKGDGEKLEILQEIHEYQQDNGAEMAMLDHELTVELQGIEDKGERKDRWEEHAEALYEAEKDFSEEFDDFIKDASEEDDVQDWCKDYNKAWEKIQEERRENRDDYSRVGTSGLLDGCPEEEMGGGGRGGGGGGGNYGGGYGNYGGYGGGGGYGGYDMAK